MKILINVTGAVLGLMFVAIGLMVLLGLGPTPPAPPEGTPPAHFFAAVGPTGFMTFVKICEVLGGLLTAIPRTRTLGLLVLGPIITNIVAYHLLIVGGDITTAPLVLGPLVLLVLLVLAEAKAFAALVRRPLPGSR